MSWFSLAALNESIVQFDSMNSIQISHMVYNATWGARHQLALKVAVMMFFLSELWNNNRSDLPVIIFRVMVPPKAADSTNHTSYCSHAQNSWKRLDYSACFCSETQSCYYRGWNGLDSQGQAKWLLWVNAVIDGSGVSSSIFVPAERHCVKYLFRFCSICGIPLSFTFYSVVFHENSRGFLRSAGS